MNPEINIDGVPYVRKDTIKVDTYRDWCFLDAANVMLMGRVKNVDTSSNPLNLVFDFPHTDVRIITDMKSPDAFEVWRGNEVWGKYSMEYLNKAKRVAKAWHDGKIMFAVQDKKHTPMLLYAEELGFILAPRIETVEEEKIAYADNKEGFLQ